MTRLGMIQPSAEDAAPPATDQRVPMAIVDANKRLSGPTPGRQHRAEAQRNGLSASIPVLPSGDRAIADISRGSKSP